MAKKTDPADTTSAPAEDLMGHGGSFTIDETTGERVRTAFTKPSDKPLGVEPVAQSNKE